MTTTNATQTTFTYQGREFVVRPASNGSFCVFYRFFGPRRCQMVWIGDSPTNTPDDLRETVRVARARGEF